MVRSHPHRLLAVAGLAGLAVLVALLAVSAVPATLRATTGQLLSARAQARQLAAQVADLDAGITAATAQCARAGDDLRAIRHSIRRTRRLQQAGRLDLQAARATLAQRAVALYKHDDMSTLAVVLGSGDFASMEAQLAQVQQVVRADKAMLRAVVQAQARLRQRSESLAADARAAQRLIQRRDHELAAIKSQLGARQALLDNTRADIRRLVSLQTAALPAPAPTSAPAPDKSGSTGGSGGAVPATHDGSGPWWPLIEQVAAVNGVSARGMYRLMMLESGGDATVVGPGGYFGLFQYAPSTWKGSWNPYRSSSITDGSAQIRATALALKLGYGHPWWDPSYSYSFGGG